MNHAHRPHSHKPTGAAAATAHIPNAAPSPPSKSQPAEPSTTTQPRSEVMNRRFTTSSTSPQIERLIQPNPRSQMQQPIKKRKQPQHPSEPDHLRQPSPHRSNRQRDQKEPQSVHSPGEVSNELNRIGSEPVRIASPKQIQNRTPRPAINTSQPRQPAQPEDFHRASVTTGAMPYCQGIQTSHLERRTR